MTNLSTVDDTVEIQFTMSRAELTRALRATNRAVPRIQIMQRIAWIALLVTTVLLVAGVVTPAGSILFLFVPGLVVFILWLTPLYLARMSWKHSPFWTSQQTWHVTATGLVCVSGGIETHTSWAAIVRTVETPDFFLFFSSAQVAQFIPTRALSPERLALVRDIARRRVGTDGGPAVSVKDRPAPLVEAKFLIDPGEIGRAGILAARKTGSLWISYAVVILIVAWNTLPWLYSQWRRGGLTGISVPVLLLGLAPLAIIFLAPRLSARWAARRYSQTAPSAKGTQHVGIADWGLQVSGPFYSGALEWAALIRADESRDFFLFFLAKLQPVYIPKRVLSPEEIEQVRALVRDGLGTKAKLLGA